MMMGEYAHALDDKGRIVLPARFRDAFPENRLVVTKGLDGCLWLYPMAEWATMVEKLGRLPMTDPSARAFVRLFMAGAQEVEIDRQFRMTVPPRLREYAGMEKDVVLIGLTTRAELWSAERWARYQAETQAGYETMAEKMAELGL
ncbi:MAG: division/cell wall cluster transcriptional repressor MraZ [Firmicutes bacterium]|nr:division/cell wall cluster transcriptional repressor MraZ [Alicyclobacillaceae bacterium]MCL6497792.1 division/cell wall cluster transcriptional repressor MraZ [Bacillota bacterium]